MAVDDTLVGMPDTDGSAAYLSWEDLTVVLPSYRRGHGARTLIRGITGYALPGRLLAIMGPSGSGKSTLLDALAGRLSNNVMMSGRVLLNGNKARMEYGEVAYVTQENNLLGTLTVRETITYSAQLRLPAATTTAEVKDVVDAVMANMGLADCADGTIGNWHLRGISGGEKKRLSIALEVLTKPRLLFLDEPTSGLDSAAAFFVAAALRQMAEEGMTVVSSIHQPSGDVFSLFGDLCLLSGGDMVYFGDAMAATQFFEQAGFGCPKRRSPSDHYLRCINTDFDQVNAKIARSRRHCSSARLHAAVTHDPPAADPLDSIPITLVKSKLLDHYRSSNLSIVQSRIAMIPTTKGLKHGFSSRGSRSIWFRQLTTLTRRSTANMSRDLGYYWIRIATYVLVSLCVGSVYFQVGTTYASIVARTGSAAFVFGFMSLMSMGGFPSFIEEMKVFHHERLNGHYGVAVYILSNHVSSSPFLVAVAVLSSIITYYMVGLRPGFSHFVFFAANLYGCVTVVESLMMIVSAFVPNFLMGVLVGSGIMVGLMLTAGYVRLLPELPKPIWRYPVSYLSYGSWALQGQYKNDMLGLEFESMSPGAPKLQGADVIENTYGVSLDHSKWLDLSMIFVIVVVYKLVFFVVLKIKEKASPLLRFVYMRMAGYRPMNADDTKNRPLQPILCSCSEEACYDPVAPI